jgi:hypothetical protein
VSLWGSGTKWRIAPGLKQPPFHFLAEKFLKHFFTLCVDFVVIWLMTSLYALVGGIK